MFNFPKWKIIAIIIICIVGTLFSIPNVLPQDKIDKLPKFMRTTLNLGLDLKGGSHLLLQTDLDAYLKEQFEQLKDLVRKELRAQKIGYIGLKTLSDHIEFQIRDEKDLKIAEKLLSKICVDNEIKIDNKRILVSYNDDQLKILKSKLIEQSIEIIRRRIDEHGTREPIIQRQGDTSILLQVPGLYDPKSLKDLLGKTAKMTFHIVLDEYLQPTYNIPAGTMLVANEKTENHPQTYLLLTKNPGVTGDLLESANATLGEYSRAQVGFKFNHLGGKQFAELTKNNVGKRLAIVLDNKVISAPVVNEAILGGQGSISGNFTIKTANELALMLRAGALPTPLHIIEERTVGPSLGNDSIEAGKTASIMGVIGVMLFMFMNYGLLGMFANISLIFNLFFLVSILTLIQATLTMPGIAAIVLTMGMAVDANVLIFERIREEFRSGISLNLAIERGFNQAFTTILDSNLTTIIAALLLYYFGTGPVKGFAVSLNIGILTSMFTAITLTKLMIALWVKRSKPKTLSF